MKTIIKKLQERIDELEKQVRELQTRPAYYHYYYQMPPIGAPASQPIYPTPYIYSTISPPNMCGELTTTTADLTRIANMRVSSTDDLSHAFNT